ncbi:hypothetical protein CH373_10095 [Leptospira perolatii]|uniref:Tetratricopeptide repeat protein n=1 Tax=Leptospira perolatii TaxID=2023191 RepID=A0A2M9ZMY4_9LEPT|nr:hypothetical protein CH360_07840 [Leptospira perolatii]PJZ73407.1 hypothetical protein CH373_10095 [Leptospira perolatii]
MLVLAGLVFFSFERNHLEAEIPLPFPEDVKESDLGSAANSTLDEKKEPSLAGTKESSQVVQPGNNEVESDSLEAKDASDRNGIKASAEKGTSEQMDQVQKSEVRSTKLPNLNTKNAKKPRKKMDQDPGTAAYERGILRLRNGQKEAAQEEFTKAAASESEVAAKAKLELAKLSGAKSETTEEVVEDEIVWKTRLETARSYRSQEKNQEAEVELLKVATEAPSQYRIQALLQMGDLLNRLGRYRDSRSYLLDYWNRFGRKVSADPETDPNLRKKQWEERDLGAYLLFKASYKSGETEWSKRFLRKFLESSSEESKGFYSPLREELEKLAKQNI